MTGEGRDRPPLTEDPETPALEVTEPGLYGDIPEETYHADPVPAGSLSASGAKLLVPPSTPAHFRWAMDHPQPIKKQFDIGNAAHAVVLGTGPELREIPADSLASNGAISTKEAKKFVADARADGAVPLKPEEYKQIHDMADAIRNHPIAGRLFDPANGRPEQAMFWEDDRNGIIRRARLDWLPNPTGSGRLILPDYKTAACAERWQWIRRSVDFGVHMQHANYIDGAKQLGLGENPAFVFVVQEKTAPYLISVIQVDVEAAAIGEELMNLAAKRFAECTRTGVWPGYADEVQQVSLPRYYVTQMEDYFDEQQ